MVGDAREASMGDRDYRQAAAQRRLA